MSDEFAKTLVADLVIEANHAQMVDALIWKNPYMERVNIELGANGIILYVSYKALVDIYFKVDDLLIKTGTTFLITWTKDSDYFQVFQNE